MADTAEIRDRFAAALDTLEQDGDVDAMVALYADDAQIGNVLTRGAFSGPEGARDFWQEYRGTFRDLHSTYRSKSADGPVAVLEWQSTGHLADGTPVDYDGVSVLEVADGRVTRFTAYFNPRELDPVRG